MISNRKTLRFALRQCRRSKLGEAWLTYKGPNQDAVGKIREEHEIRLTEDWSGRNSPENFCRRWFSASGSRAKDSGSLSAERCRLRDVEFCVGSGGGSGGIR